MVLMVLGCAMLVFAVAVPSASYSAFLTGGNKDLSWGPALFRILLAFHGTLLIIFGWKGKHWSARGENGVSRPAGTLPLSGRMILGLIILSAIALALRLWKLDSDLWIDEVLTLLDFVRQPLGQIVTSFPSQNQHMLFSLLAKLSTTTFGESAWSLRLPSVFLGVGSIWAFFFLCRRLLGQTEAFWGCVLLTVSYHHIWFSQNARGYMGLLFFTLLATWFWLEAIKSTDRKWWVAYCVSVVLGMWINITMACVVAVQGIIYFALLLMPRLGGDPVGEESPERRAGLKPIVAWILSITVTLQLYALAFPEFLTVGLHEESKQSEWTKPLWVITESLNSLSIGFAGISIVICGALFVAFGWFSLFRKNRRAAVMMVLPGLLAGSTMLALGHNLWPRFFFFSMGFGLLIVIHGAMELPKLIKSLIKPLQQVPAFASFAGIGLVVILILASLVTLPKNYALPKQDFTGAKNYVELHSSPSDEQVAVSLAGMVYGKYITPHLPVAETARDLEVLQQSGKPVWLIYTIPIELKTFRPDIWRVIERDFEVAKVFPGTLGGGEIFVCQKKPVAANKPMEKLNAANTNFSSIK